MAVSLSSHVQIDSVSLALGRQNLTIFLTPSWSVVYWQPKAMFLKLFPALFLKTHCHVALLSPFPPAIHTIIMFQLCLWKEHTQLFLHLFFIASLSQKLEDPYHLRKYYGFVCITQWTILPRPCASSKWTNTEKWYFNTGITYEALNFAEKTGLELVYQSANKLITFNIALATWCSTKPYRCPGFL